MQAADVIAIVEAGDLARRHATARAAIREAAA
jgi:hypothetical protein